MVKWGVLSIGIKSLLKWDGEGLGRRASSCASGYGKQWTVWGFTPSEGLLRKSRKQAVVYFETYTKSFPCSIFPSKISSHYIFLHFMGMWWGLSKNDTTDLVAFPISIPPFSFLPYRILTWGRNPWVRMFHSTLCSLGRIFNELKEARANFKDENDGPNCLRALFFW